MIRAGCLTTQLSFLSSCQTRLVFSHTWRSLLQLLIMSLDVLKGIQQGQEQSRLTMIVVFIVWRANTIDVVYDVGIGTEVDFPLAHSSSETEVLIGNFIGITLLSAQGFQVAYRFTLSSLIGNRDGTLDVEFSSWLAELTGGMAGTNGVLVSGEASDVA